MIDAEIEYKQRGMAEKAEQFMKAIRGPLTNIPIALSSYRYPKYHPELPWKQFLQYCDYNMPQVYWEQAHTPASQLERSFEQFKILAPNRRFIPTGAFYKTNGWLPSTQDIQEFLRKSTDLGCKATNFYTWDHKKYLPEQWEILASYDWNRGSLVQTFGQRMIAMLNASNYLPVARYFGEDAVHISAKKTISGRDKIAAYYQSIFEIERPGAKYELINEQGDEKSCTVVWKAVVNGKEIKGRDSFGLNGEKIIYQYSQIM